MALNRRKFLLGAAGTAGVAATAGAGWWAFGRWQLGLAERPMIAWMREHRQAFDAAQPDSIAAGGDLLAGLSGAKVVGIGEATHGSHEDVACKAAVLRALVQSGAVDTLLLEANGPGGRDLDAFVAGEPGDPVERVRAAPIFRVLKTQALAETVDWLREWNRQAPRRVHIVGIDCQATAADAAFALAWLDTVDAAAAADFRARLAPVVSAEAQALRFPALIASITTAQLRQAMVDLELLRAVLAADGPHAARDGRADAERAARIAWQGLHAFEMEASDGKLEGDIGAYYSRRDVSMAENILQAAGGGGVYWAHNSHVAAAPLGFSGETLTPTGHHLRKALGPAYKAVLFEYSTARFTAVPWTLGGGDAQATDPVATIDWGYRGGRLAGLFRALGGGDGWVDLAALPATPELAAWAARDYPMRTAGWGATPWVDLMEAADVKPGAAIDILVHIEALSPARLLA
jgi:erythromycin esterase